MLASRQSRNQKKGFSEIVPPLVNSQFYEAIKCCHDNQLQHLSRTADSEEVSVLTKSGRNDDIELATQHLA